MPACGCSRPSVLERRIPRAIPTNVQEEVLAKTSLTAQEVISLYKRFRYLAPSGEMSFGKFRNTMGMLGMLDDLFLPYRMFCAFDSNEDGRLDFVEFAVAIGTMIRGDDDAKLGLAFKILSPLRSNRQARRIDDSMRKYATSSDAYRAEACNGRLGRNSASHPDSGLLGPSQDDRVAGEDGLTLPEFQAVVASLESTRRQLVGGAYEPINDWQVERIFRAVSSTREDGTPFMTLADFKNGVKRNADFLWILGIYPGTFDRHLNNATRGFSRRFIPSRVHPINVARSRGPDNHHAPQNDNAESDSVTELCEHEFLTKRLSELGAAEPPDLPAPTAATPDGNQPQASLFSRDPEHLLHLKFELTTLLKDLDTALSAAQAMGPPPQVITSPPRTPSPLPIRSPSAPSGHTNLRFLSPPVHPSGPEASGAAPQSLESSGDGSAFTFLATSAPVALSIAAPPFSSIPDVPKHSSSMPILRQRPPDPPAAPQTSPAAERDGLTPKSKESTLHIPAESIQQGSDLDPLQTSNVRPRGKLKVEGIFNQPEPKGQGDPIHLDIGIHAVLEDPFQSNEVSGGPADRVTPEDRVLHLLAPACCGVPSFSIESRTTEFCSVASSPRGTSGVGSFLRIIASTVVSALGATEAGETSGGVRSSPAASPLKWSGARPVHCGSPFDWSERGGEATLAASVASPASSGPYHSLATPSNEANSSHARLFVSGRKVECSCAVPLRKGEVVAEAESCPSLTKGEGSRSPPHRRLPWYGLDSLSHGRSIFVPHLCSPWSSALSAQRDSLTDPVGWTASPSPPIQDCNGASQAEKSSAPAPLYCARMRRSNEVQACGVEGSGTRARDFACLDCGQWGSLDTSVSEPGVPHGCFIQADSLSLRPRLEAIPDDSSLLRSPSIIRSVQDFWMTSSPSQCRESHGVGSAVSDAHEQACSSVALGSAATVGKLRSTVQTMDSASPSGDRPQLVERRTRSSPASLSPVADDSPILFTGPAPSTPHPSVGHIVAAKTRVNDLISWVDTALHDTTVGAPPVPSELKPPTKFAADLASARHPTLSQRASFRESTEGPRMYMNKPNFDRQKRQGSIAQLQQRIQRRRPEYKFLDPQKGFAVHFGHPSWNMVLNMMVGIRLAAGRINNEPKRRVEAYDFIMKEKISILPRSANTVDNNTSSKQRMEAVRFIDYAPMVFRKIREFFGINAQDYLQSIGPEQLLGNMVLGNLASLSELCSEGKSGAFFYYTGDGRFLIKTVARDAAKFLQHILKDYYEHIISHPETLITRFYGYHAIRLKKESGNVGAKLYFVIMGNVFHTPVEIHRRYDLKGSWVGRSSGTAARSDPTIALKDMDLIELKDTLKIGSSRKASLISVLQEDAAFFQRHLILDYSLLVGIHYRPKALSGASQKWYSFGPIGMSRDAPVRRPFHQRDMGGMASVDGTRLYYIGIVDILTRWTAAKRLEHDFKAVKTRKGTGISCVHPDLYATRFVEFLNANTQ